MDEEIVTERDDIFEEAKIFISCQTKLKFFEHVDFSVDGLEAVSSSC